MSTFTDEEMARLLDEVASSYDVPEHGPTEIVAALKELPAAPPVYKRKWIQLSSAAAVVTAGLVLIAAYGGGDGASQLSSTASSDSAKSAPGALTFGKTEGGGDQYRVTGGTTGGGRAALTGLQPGGVAAPVPAAALPQQVYNSIGSASGGGGSKAVGSTAVGGGVAAGAPGAGSAPVVNAPATDEGESRVVKSGSIALVVKDKRVSPTLRAVSNAAKAEGGYIAASSSDEYGDNPAGEVTIRVPVARFESLVDRIRGLDAKVRTANTSGKDVTAAYSDLDSQLRTLKATRERFLLILSKTRTISEILTVQQRVDTVSGQIDRIEGQRKLLGNQSDLSTLAVSVSEEGDPIVKVTQKRSGLAQAFTDAKDGFVGGVESIVRHSGGALLFLIVLVVVLLLGRVTWRVARRRML